MKNNNYLELMKLVKEKKYEEIYNKFGKKTYLRVTPAKYKAEDITKLMDENNIDEIEKKYDKETYKVCMKSIEKNKKVSNIKLKFINPSLIERTKRNVAFVLAVSIGFTGIITNTLISNAETTISENSQIYASDINDYNKELEEYAKYINSLGLNDLEIIIKVMHDTWSNIDGYKTSKNYNIISPLWLSVYKEGIGVCRNLSADFSARMNAINPDYEATNLLVYYNEAPKDKDLKLINDINARIVPEDNTTTNTNSEKVSIEETNDFDITKITGNHMVSCIKLKDENILLIIDPTNPSIGILKDGKITMFNDFSDGIDIKPFGTVNFGKDVVLGNIDKITESFFTEDIAEEDLNKRFGLDTQNEVLNDIKENYDTSNYKIKKMK